MTTPARAVTSAHLDSPILGLQKVEGKFRHKTFYYKLSDGTTMVLYSKLKGIKDLRTEEERHPKLHYINEKFRHYDPLIQGSSGLAGLGINAYALTKLIHIPH